MTTLVEELKVIEQIPESAGVDKSSSYRNLLRYWYERSDLVRRSVSGQTSPSKETDKVAKRFGGWKAFVPVYFREEDRRQIQALEPLVENVHRNLLNRFSYMSLNPVSLAAVFAASFTAIDQIFNYVPNIQPGSPAYSSPQEVALAFAVIGAIIGICPSIEKMQNVSNMRNDGRYLESRIREIGGV